MNKQFLIGTDIGTSGTKTILISSSGKILAEAYREYDILVPQALWAEQWPDVWLDAAMETIKEAVEKSHVSPMDVKGICISGLYGGSGVPLDEKYDPVRPCIIWMDRRADAECEQVKKTVNINRIFEITGNGIDSYFGFAKILWIKNNEPENWKKIKLFLAPNQYVVYKLTGIAAMDHTSAGNLGGIYDLRTHSWSPELMEEIGIPRGMMPENLVEPHSIVGVLTNNASEELGLMAGTPVCAGCIDCLASTIASGVLDDNEHTAIIGTSINWGAIHSTFPTNISYITMPYAKDTLRINYTYGGASTAGALPKWFRDQLIRFGDTCTCNYDELDAQATSVSPGSNGLIVLPYFMGERSPIWDVNAKGTVVGLTLQHNRAHLYRAFLEAVAYSLRHIMETSQIALTEGSKLTLIGGATRSTLWKQIFADVTGVTVRCSSMNVEAPLGDALIAGIGTGVLHDYSVIRDWVVFDEEIVPDLKNHQIYTKYYLLYKEVYLALKSTMKAMSNLP